MGPAGTRLRGLLTSAPMTRWLWLAIAGGAVVGCATPAPPRKAEGPTVVRTDEAIDLSGDWNDVDADTVAKALIESCLADSWAETWTEAHGRKPVLRLYPVRNKTDGYIDYRYLTKQFEAALVQSHRVEVVSSLEEAEDNRAEREDQMTNASEETSKSQGEETGSDFIVNGWIVSQNDAAKNRRVRTYLTSLEVIETSSNKKVWVGQKRLKKLITDESGE